MLDPTWVMGRAVIAMTAVRRDACDEPGRNTDHPDVRPPTDATQSRPYQRGGAARVHVGTVTRGPGEMAKLKGRPGTG